jgi:hypothetical protein
MLVNGTARFKSKLLVNILSVLNQTMDQDSGSMDKELSIIGVFTVQEKEKAEFILKKDGTTSSQQCSKTMEEQL